MAYLGVDSFKFGIDRRRPRVAGVPGTLWLGVNIHLSRGGDVERAKRFVPGYTLPANTFGLTALRSQLYTFGSAAPPAMSVGVLYQQLATPDVGESMVRILDTDTFGGKLYVIAEFTDGNVYHYYNGARVTDWDAVADANTDFSALAGLLALALSGNSAVSATASGQDIIISARVPGTEFTIAQSTVNRGAVNDQIITITQLAPNVAKVDEVRASADVTVTGGSEFDEDNEITSVKVNGVEILPDPVRWTATNEATAIRLQQALTSASSTSEYDATVTGATVTVRAAPGTGAAPNGLSVVVTTGGDVTTTADPALAGGVTAVAPQRQIEKATLGGTFEPQDVFRITINGATHSATGRAAGTGRSAWTFKQRVFSPSGTLLRYCMLNQPTVWNPATAPPGGGTNDAGFINMANETAGNDVLVGVAEYNGRAAVFSRNAIRIWDIFTDPAENRYVQTLANTGTSAPRSLLSYGNNDVFYLDTTGIRSIRAREATDTASTSDVGNAIDVLLHEHFASLPTEVIERASAVLEPVDGRYWLNVDGRIYVLSYFPGPKISAWSYYEPGFEISDMVRVDDRVFVRADDTVYVYGGFNGDEYPDDDEMVATVESTFINASAIAQMKKVEGFDIACENEWYVEILVDPNDLEKVIVVGKVNRTTYHLPADMVPGRTSHFAPRFICRRRGRATISSFAIHYTPAEQG